MKRRRVERAPKAVVVVAVITVVFLVLPLVGLLHEVAWSSLGHDLSTPVARDALRLSLVTSVAATCISLLLGLPLAWVLGRFRFPGRNLVQTLATLPMVMPPVVAGVALLGAFGREGLVGRPLFSLFGVQVTYRITAAILAEAFVAMPFLVITMAGAFAAVDRHPEEVAADLGAGRWMVFRRLTLPAVAPSLVAGVALCWARALGEFGATLTFAGNIQGRTQTLPLAIELALQDNAPVAVALSVALLGVSIVVLVALRGRWVGALTGGLR